MYVGGLVEGSPASHRDNNRVLCPNEQRVYSHYSAVKSKMLTNKHVHMIGITLRVQSWSTVCGTVEKASQRS